MDAVSGASIGALNGAIVANAKDLLGFKADKINQWIEQGYEDASRCIGNVSKALQLQTTHQEAIEKRNQAVANLDDDFFYRLNKSP